MGRYVVEIEVEKGEAACKEEESVEKAKDKLIEASLNFAEALSWNRVIVKSANDQTEIWKMHNWDVGGVEGVWWDAVIDYQLAKRDYNDL